MSAVTFLVVLGLLLPSPGVKDDLLDSDGYVSQPNNETGVVEAYTKKTHSSLVGEVQVQVAVSKGLVLGLIVNTSLSADKLKRAFELSKTQTIEGAGPAYSPGLNGILLRQCGRSFIVWKDGALRKDVDDTCSILTVQSRSVGDK